MMRSNLFGSHDVHPAWMLLTLGAIVACGSGSETPDELPGAGGEMPVDEPDELPGAGGEMPVDEPDQVDQTPGIHRGENEVTFRTERFTLEPTQERFVCYTQTLEEDLVIDGYSQGAKPFVHHVVFAKTNGMEPEGSSECDVLFRFTWEPIFLSGAGASEIQFPQGVGQVLPAGTRLLAQLHLLNAGSKPVTDSAELRMHPSSEANPRPMATYALGNFGVNLPPKQKSTVESVCTVPETVDFVAAFPHMHYLGTSLTFEVGPSEDKLTKVFERNPYNFDDQRLELIDLTLNAGDVTRVTCHYDNPMDQTITFGESTNNEMCFLVGFAAGRETTSGCVIGTPGELTGAEP